MINTSMITLPDLPLFRQTDPATSRVAADKAASFKARHISLIWCCLKDNGAMGPKRIARMIGLDYIAVQRRRFEMISRGIITCGPEVEEGCEVWRVA